MLLDTESQEFKEVIHKAVEIAVMKTIELDRAREVRRKKTIKDQEKGLTTKQAMDLLGYGEKSYKSFIKLWENGFISKIEISPRKFLWNEQSIIDFKSSKTKKAFNTPN